MRAPFSPRAIAFCGSLAVLLLGGSTVFSLWQADRLSRSFQAVDRMHRSLAALNQIEVLTEHAETGVQGFVLTGQAERLAPWRYARLMTPHHLRELEGHIGFQPELLAPVRRLGGRLADYLAALGRAAELQHPQGAGAARRALLERHLSEVRQGIGRQLEARRGRTAGQALRTKGVMLLATAVSFGLLGWVFHLLRREMGERIQAEAAARRSERFLVSVIERIPHMILVKEADHLRLKLVNRTAEEWLGRPREALLGSSDFDLRPREEARRALQEDRQALRDGQPLDLPEQALLVPGREPRVVRTLKIPVPDEAGGPAHLLTIAEDVTRQKQAEQLLQHSRDAAVESAQLKSEFIRNMSHEIRTPLSVVLGMNALLLDSGLTDGQRRWAESVQRAAEGLLALSKGILDFSKIEAGAFALETSPFSVRDLCDRVVGSLADQARAKGLRLETRLDAQLPAVLHGDAARLRQVLAQLAGNAVKFTERGEVVVEVAAEPAADGRVLLRGRVSDTGIGIPEALRSRVFEPFRQGDGSKTRRYGGTGLGLALTRRLVELMGGEIGFESAAGEGSTFWFTVRLRRQAPAGPAVEVATLPWVRARVLLVSDDEVHGQWLRQQLGAWALASEAVMSGEAALERLRREAQSGRPLPIVLSELHLPDMDAAELARALRREPPLSRAQLVVLVSGESPLDAGTAAALGFNGQVAKPVDPQALYERLATLIDPAQLAPRRAA